MECSRGRVEEIQRARLAEFEKRGVDVETGQPVMRCSGFIAGQWQVMNDS